MNHAIISQLPEIRAEMRIEEARQFMIDCKVGEWVKFDDVPRNVFTEVYELINSGWRWIYLESDDGSAFKKSLDIKLTKYEKNTTKSGGHRA